ncbi:peptidoglycan DD-metalloendopeptidase family protein [Glutamicibacter mishrai]|uniref:peptidoglycan DD-metalloendopeptidase family protein n=1 Tax=Glutamicibacter mishrai TaxID=1775880 RepID=UPI0020CC9EE7|nr:peptidoglycan DD-metalloendopeptidase family protein [Glutamicibacter mishrai]UTT41153.1 peptidoglycan DD-metalloendopeptidase family protein [Glutamicibacter mishrai]
MPRGILGTRRRLPDGALAIAAAFVLSSALAWPGAAGAMPAMAESSAVAFSAESQPLIGSDVVTVPDMSEVAGIEITGLKSGTERLGGSEPGPVAQVAEHRAAMTATSSSGVTVPPAPIAASQEIRPAMLRTGLLLEHSVATRQISSAFGWRTNPTGAGHQIHIGQDYPIACGSPVRASETGRVIVAGWAGHSGQRVTIGHGNRVQTGYSHNSLLLVSVGEFVVQGQVIALSGTTGNSTGCHVHFEVIVNGQWQNPSNYLPMAGGQRRAVLAAGPFAVDAGSALRQQLVAGAFGHSSGPSSNRGSAGEERPTRAKHYQADPVKPSADGNHKKAKAAKPKTQPKKDHSKTSPSPRTTQPAPQPSKVPKPPKKLEAERPKAQPTPSPTQTPVPVEPSAPTPSVPTAVPIPSAPTAAPTPSTGPVEQPSVSASPTASPTESTMPSASPSAVETPAPEKPTKETESSQTPPSAAPTLAPEPSPDSGIEPQQEKETGNPDTSDHEEETEPTAGTEKIIGVAQPKIVDMQAEKDQKAPPVAKELARAKPAAPEKKSAKKQVVEKPKPAVADKPKAAVPAKKKPLAPAKPKPAVPAKAAAPAAKKVAKAPAATVPQPQPKPKLQPKPKPKPPVAAPAVQKAAPAAAKPKPKATVPAPAEAAAPAKVPQPPAGTAPAASEAKP